MPKSKTLEDIPFFKDALWDATPASRDSEFVRPLFAEHYNGPRNCAVSDRHPFWEFTAVLGGEGALHLRGRNLPLEEGMLALVPPDAWHMEVSRSMETIWIGFEGRLMQKTPVDSILSVQSPLLTKAAEKLWIFSERRFGKIGFELDGMLIALVGGFFRVLSEGGRNSDKNPVEKAIEHLHDHFAEAVSFSDLAERLGLSEGYFYRLFKARTGKTPAEYLTDIRVERATRWLKMSDARVADVGAGVGYPNPFYFSRVFKKTLGMSPKEYRRTCRGALCEIVESSKMGSGTASGA